ncbi:transglycosylase SLT domain-containing protein [Pseudomonadota bacterium]
MAMAWLSKLVVVAAIVLAGTGSTDHSPDRVHPAASVRASNAVVRDRGLLLHDKSVAHHPNFRASKATLSASIWPRLIDGFTLPAGQPDFVRAELGRVAENPRNVEQLLQRGGPYLHFILSEVQERGLPSELALLPVIESAFDPFARSPQLATGLWQFLPHTAVEFDLQLDSWYDERRDLIAGTNAALDFLTQLHRRFDGDWLLALAAYNAGPARVHRAMRHNRDAGKPIGFWDLDLPEETRDYLPKLLAMRAIVKAPADYGVRLPTIRDEAFLKVVEAHGPLDLGVAARLAGVTLEEMHRLNAGYSRRTVRQDGPISLVVPRSTAADFTAKLASLTESEREPWVRHRIRFGDTLSAIARYYDVPLGRLREFNRLADARIVAGDVLIVPVVRS